MCGSFNPDNIAAVEVYRDGFTVPTKFQPSSKDDLECGAVIVWTKFAFP